MLKLQVNILQLIRRMSLLLLLYSLLRFIFFISNLSYFYQLGFKNLSIAFFGGLRFDISAISFTNALFILLHLIPFKGFASRSYQLVLKTLFLLVNIPVIILNCSDIVYYKFTLKRGTMDAFDMAEMSDDFKNVLPQFIRDYWYVAIIIFILIFLMIKLYNRTSNTFNTASKKVNLIVVIIISIFTVIGARGGLQLRPLSIFHAAEYGSPQTAPLVLNTTFTMIKTIGKTKLSSEKYFDDKTLSDVFNPIHQLANHEPFKKMNVVIIIMESFSKEYIGGLNSFSGYTPFLDSLIYESLVFNNGFANGKKSIEGIPAVLAGMPVMMNEPFITSQYSGNKITGIADILKQEGYSTSFFHGGSNGTMGFDGFTKSIGFDNYYGRKEYNNDANYDGKWGIFDEPFFQYFAKELNKTSPPFISCIFSLSSHHPYTIPEKYKGKFMKGTLPIHQSIRYADYSLQKFFEAAAKMPWFDNTLFVITADHTFESEHAEYQTPVGKYRIPIIFYQHNSSLHSRSDNITQQVDIMPSILDYLHYPKPFYSFGSSVFNPLGQHVAVNCLEGIYQIITRDYSLQFDGTKSLFLSNYSDDVLMRNNLLNKELITKEALEQKLKAIIQTYNQAMIHNKFSLPNH